MQLWSNMSSLTHRLPATFRELRFGIRGDGGARPPLPPGSVLRPGRIANGAASPLMRSNTGESKGSERWNL